MAGDAFKNRWEERALTRAAACRLVARACALAEERHRAHWQLLADANACMVCLEVGPVDLLPAFARQARGVRLQAGGRRLDLPSRGRPQFYFPLPDPVRVVKSDRASPDLVVRVPLPRTVSKKRDDKLMPRVCLLEYEARVCEAVYRMPHSHLRELLRRCDIELAKATKGKLAGPRCSRLTMNFAKAGIFTVEDLAELPDQWLKSDEPGKRIPGFEGKTLKVIMKVAREAHAEQEESRLVREEQEREEEREQEGQQLAEAAATELGDGLDDVAASLAAMAEVAEVAGSAANDGGDTNLTEESAPAGGATAVVSAAEVKHDEVGDEATASDTVLETKDDDGGDGAASSAEVVEEVQEDTSVLVASYEQTKMQLTSRADGQVVEEVAEEAAAPAPPPSPVAEAGEHGEQKRISKEKGDAVIAEAKETERKEGVMHASQSDEKDAQANATTALTGEPAKPTVVEEDEESSLDSRSLPRVPDTSAQLALKFQALDMDKERTIPCRYICRDPTLSLDGRKLLEGETDPSGGPLVSVFTKRGKELLLERLLRQMPHISVAECKERMDAILAARLEEWRAERATHRVSTRCALNYAVVGSYQCAGRWFVCIDLRQDPPVRCGDCCAIVGEPGGKKRRRGCTACCRASCCSTKCAVACCGLNVATDTRRRGGRIHGGRYDPAELRELFIDLMFEAEELKTKLGRTFVLRDIKRLRLAWRRWCSDEVEVEVVQASLPPSTASSPLPSAHASSPIDESDGVLGAASAVSSEHHLNATPEHTAGAPQAAAGHKATSAGHMDALLADVMGKDNDIVVVDDDNTVVVSGTDDHTDLVPGYAAMTAAQVAEQKGDDDNDVGTEVEDGAAQNRKGSTQSQIDALLNFLDDDDAVDPLPPSLPDGADAPGGMHDRSSSSRSATAGMPVTKAEKRARKEEITRAAKAAAAERLRVRRARAALKKRFPEHLYRYHYRMVVALRKVSIMHSEHLKATVNGQLLIGGASEEEDPVDIAARVSKERKEAADQREREEARRVKAERKRRRLAGLPEEKEETSGQTDAVGTKDVPVEEKVVTRSTTTERKDWVQEDDEADPMYTRLTSEVRLTAEETRDCFAGAGIPLPIVMQSTALPANPRFDVCRKLCTFLRCLIFLLCHWWLCPCFGVGSAQGYCCYTHEKRHSARAEIKALEREVVLRERAEVLIAQKRTDVLHARLAARRNLGGGAGGAKKKKRSKYCL